MNARHSRNPNSVNSAIVLVLLVVIAVETFLLIRTHFARHPSPGGTPTKRVHRIQPKPSPPVAVAPQPLVPAPKAKGQGKIAIIVDDNGNNATECTDLTELPIPVAVAILPNLRFSRQTAICAHDLDKDVMLHLPLEPYENPEKYPEDYIIKTNMSKRTVLQKLNKALASVPFVAGINNHMGSKATENYRFMMMLLPEIKARKLFFIDSKVTSRSVGLLVAKRYHIPFSARDVFLDNETDRAYIEGQFHQLAAVAKRRGYAVGIGHARPLTWQILKEQATLLQQQGFEFVSVRDLLRIP